MKQNHINRSLSPGRRLRTITGTAALMALTTFTACTRDNDTDPTRLPEGEHPLTFTASMEALTRATADNTWAGGEEAAIQAGAEVKNHTVAQDGSMTPADGIPFYWQSTADISVTAWCPASWSADRPTAFSVQADQSGGGYQQSDFLYTAQTVAFSSSGSCALTFRHLPAKVVVQLVSGEGVTPAEVAAATVNIVGQSLTSGALAADGTVARAAPGNSLITPMELTAPQGSQKSVQALLTPSRMEGKRFIRVSAGGYDYYYTPTGAEGDLDAGKQYTYTVTVQKTGLAVTLETVTAWTGTDEQVDSKTPAPGFGAADLKAGDYYYSDGQTSDGGYRQYTDGTTADLRIPPVLQDASGKPRTVAGIVFWAGNPVDTTMAYSDPALIREHPHCTHGLVVALKDASAGTYWQTAWSDIGNWMNANPTGYENIATGKGDNDNLQKIIGYNNTRVISLYNEYCDSQGGMDGNKVLPVQFIEAYAADNPAPAGSSGWYLPSPKELSTLCSGWFDGNIWKIEQAGLPDLLVNRDLVNSRLTALGDRVAEEIVLTYWSCSEDAVGPDYAFGLNFYGGWVLDYSKDNYLSRVRPVLAF